MRYQFWTQKVKVKMHSSWNFRRRPPVSRGCALLILGSKVRSQYTVHITQNGCWCITAFPFTPIIMKLPHKSRMCPINFEVKRSRSNCIDYWKWCITAFPLHLSSWIFTQTPYKSKMCTIDFGVKGQGHNELIIEIGCWWRVLSLYISHYRTSSIQTPHLQIPI